MEGQEEDCEWGIIVFDRIIISSVSAPAFHFDPESIMRLALFQMSESHFVFS